MARQERAVRTRDAILVAAGEVFDEVGYESAAISEILSRAGVTKGALYFHFASKKELAQAVLASQVTAVPEVPERELALQQGLDESLVIAHMLSTGDAIVRGSVRLTVDQGSRLDGLDRQVPMRAWGERNVAVLTRAKENGELLPQVDVEASARLFVGCFTGVQMLSKIMTNHADLVVGVTNMQRHLMAGIAVPGVLMRLDISPDRAERVYEEALAARDRPAATLDASG
ncbi:ScbR family autoregulator-binding transcription factor [Streptomyces sp. NBC_01089]|uniref:ScbR family autoregulator-binding transcription factor n=1 Tax=Streptomyces sp. NBC_01089 TaxID=2903747 RepID=UPI0038651A37|nr:TetR/AcrR family transcriptional regulator [Streptomyces sp. NBC_01089]WSU46277.1 TetR/AcrR family transcriptional regulator [Streptomyces sp. NBC_01089]